LCAGLGPKAKAAVPTLVAMLKDEKDTNVRSLAVAALKKIEPAAARRAGVP
jgi:HEAT repeat protein